eukprot:CAMPEP_0113943426 /NCGR_PEP_ID=MMETSP1339-20121228/23624_1 /TAXON_ID=94617 /ORGANISM="Fibrocapsa japonica" /LENGTH=142 /DNA_ID=CAMNT_0000948289 /DNA_START=14 /DNA_END=442 /DNA_ORIENTATION=- /assembly_acc=CAM_ASM_000762
MDHEEDFGEEHEAEEAEDLGDAEGEDGDEGLTVAEVPEDLKGLRACKRCTLIKSFTQFYENGCDNCPFLEMASNTDQVNNCTSSFFEGTVALMQPEGSWVARWQRIGSFKPGMYAIEVVGEFPPEIIQFLQDRNIPIRAKKG